MKFKKEFKVSEICDIKPDADSHKQILEMVSKRRPWRPSDSVKRHFIENIAEDPIHAAMYRARGEFFIKGY